MSVVVSAGDLTGVSHENNILATNPSEQELFFATLQFNGAATVIALQAARHDIAPHIPPALMPADRIPVDLPPSAHPLAAVEARHRLAVAELLHDPLATPPAIGSAAAEVST